MMNLFLLALFVAIGFPVALSIELYMRARARNEAERLLALESEFMPVPKDSALGRRSHEPAHASIAEPPAAA